jgi:hypothetical protein
MPTLVCYGCEVVFAGLRFHSCYILETFDDVVLSVSIETWKIVSLFAESCLVLAGLDSNSRKVSDHVRDPRR